MYRGTVTGTPNLMRKVLPLHPKNCCTPPSAGSETTMVTFSFALGAFFPFSAASITGASSVPAKSLFRVFIFHFLCKSRRVLLISVIRDQVRQFLVDKSSQLSERLHYIQLRVVVRIHPRLVLFRGWFILLPPAHADEIAVFRHRDRQQFAVHYATFSRHTENLIDPVPLWSVVPPE